MPAPRRISTQTVTDHDIEDLASKPLHPLTLGDLVKYGRPPLPASEIYNSANFTLSILPQRLAHRIQSLRKLPAKVVSNPYVDQIHDNYVHSLSTLLPWSQQTISSLEEEIRFTEVMADLVQTHADTISTLANGFAQVREHISSSHATRYLDEHLRARIGTRLIAEQHIALHFSSKPHLELSGQSDQDEQTHDYIGIIDTQLRPSEVIHHCEHMVSELCEFHYGIRPTLTISGQPDYIFAHIPVHLEYIITELLKNAYRATIEKETGRDPIEVEIIPLSSDADQLNKVSNNNQGNLGITTSSSRDTAGGSADVQPLDMHAPGVMIRVSDRGGGISPEDLRNIWNYSFTTFHEEKKQSTKSALRNSYQNDHGGSIAGLGYGLPLGRAYAEYFGGGIDVESDYGVGTTVSLSLRGVGSLSWSNDKEKD